MNNSIAVVNNDVLSRSGAAGYLGITPSALSHWLKNHPEIKEKYCVYGLNNNRKGLFVKYEGLLVIANMRDTSRSNQHKTSEVSSLQQKGKQRLAEKIIENTKLEQKLNLILKQQAELFEKFEQLERKPPKKDPLALPVALEKPPEPSYRDLINQRVRAFSQESGKEYGLVYSRLYNEFYYRYKVNLNVRANTRGLKKIDVILELGMAKEAWILACDLFPLSTD